MLPTALLLLALTGAPARSTPSPVAVTTLSIKPCEEQPARPLVCLRLWADQLNGLEALDATLVLPAGALVEPPTSTVMAAVGCLVIANTHVGGQLSFGLACPEPRATDSRRPQPLVQFYLRTVLVPAVAASRTSVNGCRINELDARCQ